MGPDILKILSNVRCACDDDYDSECPQPLGSPPHSCYEKLASPTRAGEKQVQTPAVIKPYKSHINQALLPYLKK